MGQFVQIKFNILIYIRNGFRHSKIIKLSNVNGTKPNPTLGFGVITDTEKIEELNKLDF